MARDLVYGALDEIGRIVGVFRELGRIIFRVIVRTLRIICRVIVRTLCIFYNFFLTTNNGSIGDVIISKIVVSLEFLDDIDIVFVIVARFIRVFGRCIIDVNILKQILFSI